MSMHVSRVKVAKYSHIKVTVRINTWTVVRRYYLDSASCSWKPDTVDFTPSVLPKRYSKDLASFLQGRRYQSRVRKAIRNAHAGLSFPCRIVV